MKLRVIQILGFFLLFSNFSLIWDLNHLELFRSWEHQKGVVNFSRKEPYGKAV